MTEHPPVLEYGTNEVPPSVMGISSRPVAWAIFFIGLLTWFVYGLGIVLIVWACVVDSKLAKREKQLRHAAEESASLASKQ
jgi:hypothetical protein